MLREVRDVKALAGQNIAFAERIDLATARWIQTFGDNHVKRQLDLLQTGVALPSSASIDHTFDRKHPVRLAQFQLHLRGLGKDHTFKGLDWNLVVDDHKLATAGQKPADVNLM